MVSIIADAFARAGGVGEVSTVANSALTATCGRTASTRRGRTCPLTRRRHTETLRQPVMQTTRSTRRPATSSRTRSTSGLPSFADPQPAPHPQLVQRPGRCVRSGFRGSWAEARLTIDVDGARVALPDGREVVFPRHGDGWGRALGENLWLGPTGRTDAVSTTGSP